VTSDGRIYITLTPTPSNPSLRLQQSAGRDVT